MTLVFVLTILQFCDYNTDMCSEQLSPLGFLAACNLAFVLCGLLLAYTNRLVEFCILLVQSSALVGIGECSSFGTAQVATSKFI
jgi:hypothetical protein